MVKNTSASKLGEKYTFTLALYIHSETAKLVLKGLGLLRNHYQYI